MLLARDGHEVAVLERDPTPAPDAVDAAWTGWARSGVVQFRQPHFLQPRVRRVLDRELPDVRDALLAAGAAGGGPAPRRAPAGGDRAGPAGGGRSASPAARRA